MAGGKAYEEERGREASPPRRGTGVGSRRRASHRFRLERGPLRGAAGAGNRGTAPTAWRNTNVSSTVPAARDISRLVLAGVRFFTVEQDASALLRLAPHANEKLDKIVPEELDSVTAAVAIFAYVAASVPRALREDPVRKARAAHVLT